MSMIEATNYTAALQSSEPAVNADQQYLNRITSSKSGKEQLKNVAQEFESIFISKMFSIMDKSVDKEGGLFGNESKYMNTLKPYMFNELGRNLASNPHSTFGFAKQIYDQMERYVK